MKKTTFLVMLVMACGFTISAQKKTNGTVYIEHPAIKVTDDLVKAFTAGDNAKMAGLLTADFEWINGTTGEVANKETFLKTLLPVDKFDYFSMTAYPGSYPDAVEIQKDNKDGNINVTAWYMLKGVHKITGVKINSPAHIQYTVNKDNKIKSMIEYTNSEVFSEISRSLTNRTNGKIYNHHDNINTVRKAVSALEMGDLDKNLSYYTDNVKFYDINSEWEKSFTKAEEKTNMQNFLNAFEIKSIDMIGYPDYLEYEMDNGRSVLSWWKFNLVRKSDKKAIILPMHISDNFDENGKIVSEVYYYSESLLTKK